MCLHVGRVGVGSTNMTRLGEYPTLMLSPWMTLVLTFQISHEVLEWPHCTSFGMIMLETSSLRGTREKTCGVGLLEGLLFENLITR